MAGVLLTGVPVFDTTPPCPCAPSASQRVSARPCPHPIQLVAQHARAHERVLQVQRVQATHQCQISRTDRFGHIVDATSADPCHLCLAANRQCVVAVNLRVALSHPTLMSAPSKKSFSSVSCPILACTAFRSTGGSVDAAPPPKISAARSLSCRFHSVI